MKADHQARQFHLQDNLLQHFPAQAAEKERSIAGIQADIAMLEQHPLPAEGFIGMEIGGKTYTDKVQAGEAFMDAVAAVVDIEPVSIGSYRGFDITAKWDGFEHKVTFHGTLSYRAETGWDARGNITRIDNALTRLPEQLTQLRAELDNLRRQIETAKAEAGKPFPQEDELRRKSARLTELDAALNIGGRRPDAA